MTLYTYSHMHCCRLNIVLREISALWGTTVLGASNFIGFCPSVGLGILRDGLGFFKGWFKVLI